MNKKGFTLIELMIALAVLGLIGAGTFQLFTENALYHKNNIFRQKAIFILKSQAALVRSVPLDQLPVGVETSFFSEIEGLNDLKQVKTKMSVKEAEENLRKITLNISWLDARQGPGNLSLVLYRTGP